MVGSIAVLYCQIHDLGEKLTAGYQCQQWWHGQESSIQGQISQFCIVTLPPLPPISQYSSLNPIGASSYQMMIHVESCTLEIKIFSQYCNRKCDKHFCVSQCRSLVKRCLLCLMNRCPRSKRLFWHLAISPHETWRWDKMSWQGGPLLVNTCLRWIHKCWHWNDF